MGSCTHVVLGNGLGAMRTLAAPVALRLFCGGPAVVSHMFENTHNGFKSTRVHVLRTENTVVRDTVGTPVGSRHIVLCAVC